ncbi:MAG TPA: DUF1003 domain-containing protein [Gemmatimonadaceae bacterium]
MVLFSGSRTFILNVFLSMLAAIHAPIILISQNRHAEKDRLAAAPTSRLNSES